MSSSGNALLYIVSLCREKTEQLADGVVVSRCRKILREHCGTNATF